MLLTNLSVLSFQRSLQNNLTFHAPLTTSIIPIKGTLDGFSRASTAYVEDHEGLLQLVKSGEARFWGARRVENLSTGLESFVLQGTATVTNNYDNSITVTGTGTSSANSALIQMTSMGSSYNKSYRVSIKLKASGAHIGKTIRIQVMRNSGTSAAMNTDIVVTGEWVRYACDVKTMDGATDTGVKVYVFGTAAGTDFDVKEFQVEDVTGHANQNPSEYVAVGAQWDANILSGNNTNFTTGLGDWYNPEPSRGSISHDTNRIKIVNDGTGGYAKAAYTYPFKKGRLYAVRVKVTVSSSTAGIGMSAGESGSWTSVQTISGNSGVISGTFAPTSDYGYVIIFMNSGTADGRYATFDDICVSEITHGTNVDGVKYFATQNGNTVASNIVTEATGAALSSSQLKGYLVEYARTNLALQSETFDNASWTKSQSTITADATTAPNGLAVADKLVEDATAASEHRIQHGSFTAAQHTFSVYAKAGERTRIRLMNFNATDSARSAIYDLSNGTIVSTSGAGATSAIRSIGNGWYRCILTCTSTATTAVYVNLVTGTSTVSYNGDGTSGAYIWGAQMEAAGFASTYIPTTTASVARPADVLEYAEPFANFESVGSVYAETVPMHTYTEIQLSTWRGRVVGAGTGSDSFMNFNHVNARSEVYDGTNVGFTSANSWQWTRGTKYKLASSWEGASMRIALSGTAGSDATFTGTMDASATTFRVGTGGSETTTGFCGVGNVKIYKKAYPGTRLATMTA